MEKARDEMIVSNMVSSAISAGVVKALEQDRDEAVSSLNLQFKAILKRMQGEFRSSRERLALLTHKSDHPLLSSREI